MRDTSNCYKPFRLNLGNGKYIVNEVGDVLFLQDNQLPGAGLQLGRKLVQMHQVLVNNTADVVALLLEQLRMFQCDIGGCSLQQV